MATKLPKYVPSFIQAALSGSRPVQLTFSQIRDSNVASTSSFIYDPQNAPLKSTQQLNVDWSKFENHTFFMSAQAKVNLAFEQIINGYPFDGTRAEIEKFFEGLTGFDKWIFDSFPKFKGQLHFSGTAVGEDTDGSSGVWIRVKDFTGALFPELAKNASAESVLNPKDGASLTIETQLFLPSTSTVGTQVICQKTSGSTQGFSFYLKPTGSTSFADAYFSVVSGSTHLTTRTTLSKGVFNHVAVSLNRDTNVHSLRFCVNGNVVDETKSVVNVDDMSIDASDFLIGTGSTLSLGSTTVTPTQTFSGTLDEFKVYHAVKEATVMAKLSRKSTFSTPDLKLYYRFNEPPAQLTSEYSDAVNAIVLDSSGNSLHALINDYESFVTTSSNGTIVSSSLRQDATADSSSNMIYEQDDTAPVLFPAYDRVVELNALLLSSASLFDSENPNLITKLVPSHYLLEGAEFEGFKEVEGLSSTLQTAVDFPGGSKTGGVQMMLSLLYIWARFFDEMKLYIDSFSKLRHVAYDSTDTVPNNFILTLIEQYGFHLPPLFNDSTLEQFIRAENVDRDDSISAYPLRTVQSELLRRVLINLPAVIRSKGTQNSIKSFLRAVGIDPDNSVKLKEYGGPSERKLSFSREKRREPYTMVDFSSSSTLVKSPFLSASRVELGFPSPVGTFVNGTSNNTSDGLLTSGSWTTEEIVRWSPVHLATLTSATQSLLRLHVTGSVSSSGGIVANLLAMSSSVNPKAVLYVRPGDSSSSPMLRVELLLSTSANLFDGDRWNVSFGVERNDAINSRVSSSYFLRVAKQEEGDLTVFATTSSFFYEKASTENNVFRVLNSTSNSSGTFLSVGPGETIVSGSSSGHLFLNNTSVSPPEARETALTALVSNLRFWSKALSEEEWKEHVKNFRSTGVEDPLVNYNFVTTRSGSFEKLRVDSLAKQENRRASGSTGFISFLDFSLNDNHLSGTGFITGSDVTKTELFDSSYLSPCFDEAITSEKIRSRGFLDQSEVDRHPGSQLSPVYEIVKSEEPQDDVKFSVEFSLIDALNRDIVTMFSTFDSMDNALGSPELLYSPDYVDLARLRDVYFNRISEKLNFQAFLNFYRWFDTSLGSFIQQLIPKKTNFRGVNFTVESHVLERHKIEYFSNEAYLTEATRLRIKDVLLLQQIVGSLSKW